MIPTDNNFNIISSNKNITYNEPDLTKINVNKILVDTNKDIFIFGTMEYGGVNYVGPLKKQFITKYSNYILYEFLCYRFVLKLHGCENAVSCRETVN